MTEKRSAAGAARKAERDLRAKKLKSIESANISPLPKCENPRRRSAAERSLRRWCEVYLAGRFCLKWSDDHLEQLAAIEQVIRDGGRQAIGAPRGDGKTSRLEAGILWGILTGQHSYAVLVTSVGKLAAKSISNGFKLILQGDGLLPADYPEVCYPLARLGGVPQRAGSMHVDGEHCWPPGGEPPWSRLRIALPTVAGSPCSGAVIESGGLLEASRGLKVSRGGESIRPSVALIDDPQTPKSARSPVQTLEREEALLGGVCHLGGPGREISTLAAVTVIRPGDLASRLLDRKIHPAWHGITKRMLDAWPAGCDPRKAKADEMSVQDKETRGLWNEYREIYLSDLASGDKQSKASTSLYRKNRKAMDRGAKASWKQRRPGCASAIEYAMRLYFEDPESMLAEMQNDPNVPGIGASAETLTAAEIAKRVSGYGHREIPVSVERLTWFCDVHKDLLYWGVVGWEQGFTGHMVDYGTWPQQPNVHFELANCPLPIEKHPAITASTLEGRVSQALHCLFAEIAAAGWKRQDDLEMMPELGLVDANWGDLTDHVYAACREAQRKHGLRVLPSHGQHFGPEKRPFGRMDRRRTKGMIGELWHVPPPNRGRGIRHVLFDAGRSKSFIHYRLLTAAGDPGSLTLFHAPAGRHRLLSEHLTAERGTVVSGPYGEMVAWHLIPGRDNHWLDCLVGCCVAESILGGKVATDATAPVVARQAKVGEASDVTPTEAEPSADAPAKRRRVSYFTDF